MSETTKTQRITIATRESPLALWQAEFVAARLREVDSAFDVALLGMTTRGDQWLSSPLSEVGGKGLFVKELEQAMLCLLYTSPSPRDQRGSRMPSSA